MIIVLKAGTKAAQRDRILSIIHDFGYKTHLSEGEQRTIIGVIGDEEKLRSLPLEALPGVERVMPILKPYKLASRDFRHADSVVTVNGVPLGGNRVVVIAGPCAVESRETLHATAAAVKRAGAQWLRGGAFKPRTSPYSFQGLGEEGLKMLREAGDEHGLPVVTEVMDTRDVALVERYTDVFQIGARNMQNFNLLSEVGRAKKPVILKRGMAATVSELLLSAEYILTRGNKNVILCERGIKSFEDSVRNLADISAIPNVQGASHLPVIFDPSHSTGRRELVLPMSRAAIAAGASGLLVDVHPHPDKAKCDGPQALLPDAFARLMDEVRAVARAIGREIADAPAESAPRRRKAPHAVPTNPAKSKRKTVRG